MIKNFFIKNKYAVIVTVLAVIFACINLVQFNSKQDLRKQLAVAEQNFEAAKDTIRVTKDRNNRIEYNKLSFLTDEIGKLKDLNAELYSEVKATQGKVNSIIQVGAKITHDTVPLVVETKVREGVAVSNFKFDTVFSPDNYRSIAGFTTYDLKSEKSVGQLTKDELAFSATTGIRVINGKHEIFFRPDYPGLTVTKLQGAEIDPKLFKGSTGPLINLSISAGYLPVIYDWRTGKTEWFGSKVGVSAGASININKLFKK